MKHNATIISIAIAVIIATVVGWSVFQYRQKSNQSASVTQMTSELSAAEAREILQQMDEMVYRVTYSSEYDYTTNDGQAAHFNEDSVSKISVTPQLQVTWLEGSQGNNDEGAFTTEGSEYPQYSIYHDDGTTTNYIHGDKWYTSNSDDIYAGLTPEKYFAHTWAVTGELQPIGNNAFRISQLEPGVGTYVFYFNGKRLDHVTWENPDTGDRHLYEILDEPVTREVPAEVVAAAVPFTM